MYTVYVVDDDAVILDEIVNVVPWMDNGFEVIGASTSPRAAIEQIVAAPPNVVFSDLRMPEMDGIEMMRTIASRGIDCEYVMLSAHGTFEDSRRFFKENGFDYLLKPVNQKEAQFVLEALGGRLAEKLPPEPSSDISTNPSFVELTTYLGQNFAQKHTLESLSRQFNLGSNYICNLFSKTYNTTLTRYITSLRMEQALWMMQETTQSYKSIAIDCGYPEYFYFCRVFKAYYGQSPTNYMKK